MNELHLRTGDWAVGGSEDVLVTGGVGSCVVACFWDSVSQAGGMVHMLLPLADPTFGNGRVGFAPDSALPHLYSVMLKRGSEPQNIICKLTGAGNMFTKMPGRPPEEIGGEIFDQTGKTLKTLGIPVVNAAVGGNLGRHVKFDLKNGVVRIRYTDGYLEEI